MTTSAIASRSVSLACECSRWVASSRVIATQLHEPVQAGLQAGVHDHDEIELHRAVGGGLDEEGDVIDDDIRRRQPLENAPRRAPTRRGA